MSNAINFLDPRLPMRFWDKVQPCPMTGCWIWTAYLDGSGYGRAVIPRPDRRFAEFRDMPRDPQRGTVAHRVSYVALVGDIPDGLQLDHRCRVRACCNPMHLEPVTAQENTRRGIGPAALNIPKTHCPNGHEYFGDNLITSHIKRAGRQCRACKNERARAKRVSDAANDLRVLEAKAGR